MIIGMDNVTFSYSDADVVHGITLSVAEGEFVGVFGPNGSGKTTLLRLLAGFASADRGDVTLKGASLSGYRRKEVARLVGIVPQDVAFSFPYTVAEVVALGRLPHSGFLGGISESDERAVECALETVDLTALAGRFVDELSGGEKRRAIVAAALAQEPEVLLLDEPTSNLDVGHAAALLDTLAELNASRGMTIIAVSHDINLLSSYVDRAVLLIDGRVAADGKPVEVLTAENIRSAYGERVLVADAEGRRVVVAKGKANGATG